MLEDAFEEGNVVIDSNIIKKINSEFNKLVKDSAERIIERNNKELVPYMACCNGKLYEGIVEEYKLF